MSTWAHIAKKDAPPLSEQPHPDQSLLEGKHFQGETTSDNHLAIVEDFSDPTPLSAGQPSQTYLPEIHRNPAPQPGSDSPHTSSVAPKPTTPTTTNNNNTMSSSQSNQDVGAKAGRKVDEAEQKAREVYEMSNEERGAKVGKKVDQAEDAAKETAEDAKNKAKDLGAAAKRDAKKLKDEAATELHKAENVVAKYYEKTKDIVLRPGTLGGVMGVANVGLLSFLGYTAYVHKDARVWNRNYVAAAVAGTLGLFAVEGIVAEQYSTTPEGQAEVERAKREGSKFYGAAKENILRPGVAGGLLGVFNLAVLGGLGYFGYERRNQAWDPKIVSGIVCGLIGLSAAEGLATKTYQQKELPEQKRKGNA